MKLIKKGLCPVSAHEEGGSGGSLSRVASWMASFAGITTAVATIMTSASAVLGLLVHHQSVQLQQAHATVSQQARQIHALKDSVARRDRTVGVESGLELAQRLHGSIAARPLI